VSDKFFDPTIGSLNTSMNLRLLQQNVISANIANADTPGYKSKTMEFENAFREALGTQAGERLDVTNPNHIAPTEGDPVEPEVYDDPNGVESLDGNTVDRSAEMAKLAENQLLFEASVDMIRKKLGMLKYAIGDGGGGGN